MLPVFVHLSKEFDQAFTGSRKQSNLGPILDQDAAPDSAPPFRNQYCNGARAFLRTELPGFGKYNRGVTQLSLSKPNRSSGIPVHANTALPCHRVVQSQRTKTSV